MHKKKNTCLFVTVVKCETLACQLVSAEAMRSTTLTWWILAISCHLTGCIERYNDTLKIRFSKNSVMFINKAHTWAGMTTSHMIKS